MMDKPTKIQVSTIVNSDITKVWKYWTEPEHIRQWNNASDDWYTPYAENDLRTNGRFSYTMSAKDGSFSFDFCGVYTKVIDHEILIIKLEDERNLEITFKPIGNTTQISETFDAENENPIELQRTGWQAILDNFKKYTENS